MHELIHLIIFQGIEGRVDTHPELSYFILIVHNVMREHCFYHLTQIADLANEDTPQLYVACGRGPRSSLRVLRHGLEVCY